MLKGADWACPEESARARRRCWYVRTCLPPPPRLRQRRSPLVVRVHSSDVPVREDLLATMRWVLAHPTSREVESDVAVPVPRAPFPKAVPSFSRCVLHVWGRCCKARRVSVRLGGRWHLQRRAATLPVLPRPAPHTPHMLARLSHGVCVGG